MVKKLGTEKKDTKTGPKIYEISSTAILVLHHLENIPNLVQDLES